MWTYEKRLQYPVKIKKCDPNMAALIISQFGGPDGELAASQRYLSQRYSVPYGEVAGLLTDIGTEELAHMEMICAIIHQLTRNLTPDRSRNPPLLRSISTIRPAVARRRVWRAVFRHRVPVQGRPDHGPDRRHGRRAEGAHDL